ncbi:glutamine synthetase beta-grasp domain-containing protein [Pseudobacteriovorax antillogorgiicola]|uniref:Glutamine synthetase n=1 Tax=Pseudobacteriovorax antillogorgiicola TaxID=1513793 RepID=A0A1Y6CEG7_9BACT|nr:glutamine synthetase beta-grasp domain-containing protein [Pseudobacteriovorax antillogorgiicola]TCS51809.1 L-glutamine synthetase [Pseudobacteriovorax antillogorgiicola]SMF50177.1 L-glutamine synthetase [Pseudobacteriovorax antillogorgiicola]
MIKQAEYIWLDGRQPTQRLRSKTRIVNGLSSSPAVEDFPEWSFDGSSTYQSPGGNSDLLLRPVSYVDDPVRGAGNYLVMCEVMNEDGSPHESNHRARLRETLEKGAADVDPWFGFEQEYVLFDGNRPLGWPENGYPPPQGPFYCGVGPNQVYGREIVEQHTQACINAGIMIYGINAEVMPAQWEFQVGYRSINEESADPLTIGDHLWMARWLLFRIGEDYGVEAVLHSKPIQGDWNGSGQHTNFSTKPMRDAKTGMATIEKYIQLLEKKHEAHIAEYGEGLDQRLTGLHETCAIHEFKSGVADRGASIRIPRQVANEGHGYIEDRRPGANANPYRIANRILKTVCELD